MTLGQGASVSASNAQFGVLWFGVLWLDYTRASMFSRWVVTLVHVNMEAICLRELREYYQMTLTLSHVLQDWY